jgi:hypothetical protein
MNTDCEPSEYGNHMVMLSIKKKDGKKVAKKPLAEEEPSVKRISE